MSSTGAKGSQQINTSQKERVQNKGAKYTEGSPSQAHRTVRCSTGQCPVHQGDRCWTCQLREFGRPLRYNSLSGVPAEQRLLRANGRLQKALNALQCAPARAEVRAGNRRRTGQSTGPVRCTNGLSGGPISQSSNGRTLTVG
jgi:hypothetical protein